MRAFGLAVCAVSVLALAPTTAGAASGDAAIIAAAKPYIADSSTPAYVRNATYTVKHSPSHPEWADVIVRSKGLDRGDTLMLRRAGHWYPRDFGTSFYCGEAPPGVVRSLTGYCDSPPPGLHQPPLVTSARFSIPCGVVTNIYGGRFVVRLPLGYTECAKARKIVAATRASGWRYYDYTKGGGGGVKSPFSDVWARTDGLATIAARVI